RGFVRNRDLERKARVSAELRFSDLDVLLTIAEALGHAHGEGVAAPRRDDAVRAVAAPGLYFEPKDADRRAHPEVRPERIPRDERASDIQDGRIGGFDEAGQTAHHRGPGLPAVVEARHEHERELLEELSVLVGHEGANAAVAEPRDLLLHADA